MKRAWISEINWLKKESRFEKIYVVKGVLNRLGMIVEAGRKRTTDRTDWRMIVDTRFFRCFGNL